jgi:hypothetical protein
VLSLAQIEQRHHGRLLVLAWVPGQNLLYDLLILRRELERDIRVVVGCVPMLQGVSVSYHCCYGTLWLSDAETYDDEGVAPSLR